MIIKEFPQLYGVASNGKIKTVVSYVEQLENGTCDIVTEHGYIDGKQQQDRRNILSGKNIGKSNETTVQQQAINEAESKWKKKKDNNYTENPSGIPDDSEKSLLPMLAHNFTKRKHNINFPCIVQPKLDGMRCITTLMDDGSIRFTTRKFKEWETLKHLEVGVRKIFERMKNLNINAPLDGELYLHGSTLQDIARKAKKYREGETEQLEYWIYDICDETLLTVEREQIRRNVVTNEDNIVYVNNEPAADESQIKEHHDYYVQEGYEGVMVRNLDGKYTFDKRSADLQKYKEFLDDEFIVIDTKSGEGRESGAIIFVCEVKNPKNVPQFEVRPRGSIEKRIEMMEQSDNYIGKQLTVRYQNLSEDNVPVFPVGIMIRED